MASVLRPSVAPHSAPWMKYKGMTTMPSASSARRTFRTHSFMPAPSAGPYPGVPRAAPPLDGGRGAAGRLGGHDRRLGRGQHALLHQDVPAVLGQQVEDDHGQDALADRQGH